MPLILKGHQCIKLITILKTILAKFCHGSLEAQLQLSPATLLSMKIEPLTYSLIQKFFDSDQAYYQSRSDTTCALELCKQILPVSDFKKYTQLVTQADVRLLRTWKYGSPFDQFQPK